MVPFLAEPTGKSMCATPSSETVHTKSLNETVIEKISHFQFPSDKALRQIWIQAIRRDVGDNFVIGNRHTKVCSRHFKVSDFRKTLAGLRKLRQDAVALISQRKQDSP